MVATRAGASLSLRPAVGHHDENYYTSSNTSSSLSHGFTSKLRSTLILSKSRITEWVEHEKERIDVQAETYRQEVQRHQATLDRAVASLLALQLKGGLNLVENDEETKQGDESMMKHSSDLEEEQRQVLHDIERIRQVMQDKEAQIEGTD